MTDFLRNHQAHLTRLKKTQAPEVLTVNGKAEVVVQDAASYQLMIERLHHMETLAAIQEGMVSAERGELKPAAQVLDEMRAKYGLSFSFAVQQVAGRIAKLFCFGNDGASGGEFVQTENGLKYQPTLDI